MSLKEYFEIKDMFKLYLTNNIFVLIYEEEENIIIELVRDENYLEKTNLENMINITYNTDISEIKDILIAFVLDKYIIYHQH